MIVLPGSVAVRPGTYQSVSALLSSMDDKTVSWTTDGGTLIGANPCTDTDGGPCTVALYTTTPGTYHVTATSTSDKSKTATATITVGQAPTVRTGHPRLIITADQLTNLRAKAVSTNPLYGAIKNRANIYLNQDNAIWSWTCKSGSGQPSTDQTWGYRENDANYFAFMSLVSPTQQERDSWGCYGHDTFMYTIRKVLSGEYPMTGNRWSDTSVVMSVTADWLMGGGYLSAADQDVVRQYLARVAKAMVNIGYGSGAVAGNYNSPAQFTTNTVYEYGNMRSMGNNYTFSKLVYLAGAAFTFDDNATDDPALTNSCGATRYQVCPDGTAGSLHAYRDFLFGGMLYKMWAHLEDPYVSWQAYNTAYNNLPTQPMCKDVDTSMVPCFGDGRGGESVEGSWYGYSIHRLQDALNMIHTAGYDDPVKYGPQLSLMTSNWWDQKIVSDLAFLTGPYNGTTHSLTNPDRWGFFTTGDSNLGYRTPADFLAHASMLVSDSYVGRSDRTEALKWLLLNSSIGGVNRFFTYSLTGDLGVPVAMGMFIALPATDTTVNPPADPRPALPTELYNGANQHILARSGWSTNDVAFSYYCNNDRIDHEHSFCGRFDIFSKGEFITKGRTEFNDYNNTMTSAEHSNLAGYQNIPTPGSRPCSDDNCLEYRYVLTGGQYYHGEQAGSTWLQHAELPTYVAAIADTTPFYNMILDFPGFNDIKHASRSLVYLRTTNQVVYYDRGVSGQAAYKKLWLTTTGAPSIGGNTATWLTRSGQQRAYFTSLLPAPANVSDAGAYKTLENGASGTDDWEPYSHIVVDAGTPTSARFLSVLEWSGIANGKSSTSYLASSCGVKFDGAAIGSSIVMFKQNWSDTLAEMTYSTAAGIVNQYVSDLTPGHTYQVTADGTTKSYAADSAGVLTFTTSGSAGTIKLKDTSNTGTTCP
jgi:hypothetical protein